MSTKCEAQLIIRGWGWLRHRECHDGTWSRKLWPFLSWKKYHYNNDQRVVGTVNALRSYWRSSIRCRSVSFNLPLISSFQFKFLTDRYNPSNIGILEDYLYHQIRSEEYDCLANLAILKLYVFRLLVLQVLMLFLYKKMQISIQSWSL